MSHGSRPLDEAGSVQRPPNCACSDHHSGVGAKRVRGPDWVVLPVRIELTTSALPRMRSTTELRQHGQSETGGRSGRQCTRGYEESVHRRQGGLLDRALSSYPRSMSTGNDERARRLAEQLRANLKRRKAQARGVIAPANDAKPEQEPSAPPRSPS